MIDLSGIVEWATALGVLSGACGLITRAITKDVARDVSDLKHTVKNQASLIDALEHSRSGDVERIVKLEVAVQSVDKAVERVERAVDKQGDAFNSRLDSVVALLTPKG